MTNTPSGSVPHTLSKPMAWSAFDYVFSSTDWRLRIRSLNPVAFCVEHDDAFASCLSGESDWQSRHQGLAWIANRVLELAASFDKTYVRRFSLQLPDTDEGPVAEALLSNLERRIRDTVLDELVQHFDTSLREWERAAQIEVARLDDEDVRFHVRRYVGLDQLVPVDAARKAIRFVFDRTHWHLTKAADRTMLNPDHRFAVLRGQRCTFNEEARARSLVARCIETLVEVHVLEEKAGNTVAPMNRARLRSEIDRLFGEKGVWGLIELSLPRDRERHYMRKPPGLNANLEALLDQQNERIERAGHWGGRRSNEP